VGINEFGGIPSDRLLSADRAIAPFVVCEAEFGISFKIRCSMRGIPLEEKILVKVTVEDLFFLCEDSSSDFIQVGVVSFGAACAVLNTPGVLPNVPNFEAFIREN